MTDFKIYKDYRMDNLLVDNLTVSNNLTTRNLNVTNSMTVSGEMHLPYPKEDALIDEMTFLLANGSFTYRNIAGNVDHQLSRLTSPAYGDGLSTPSGSDRPNPRTISNAICDQASPIIIPNTKNCTDLFWLWGQFVDHDLDLTPGHSPEEDFNIPIPIGDPDFDPNSTGTVILPFTRSIYDTNTGISTPRQQLTRITPQLDSSNIYGSTTSRCTWIRAYNFGKLKTTGGDMLPINDGTQENAGSSGNIFVSGDVRANENVALTCLHTLFMREHNYWAEHLAKKGLTNDEEIYQRARVMVESIYQSITYTEFLPLLLGDSAIPAYTAYSSGTSPTVSNEFSTAAYRLGHSLVSEIIHRHNVNGTVIPEGNLTLRDAFFRCDRYANDGDISSVFRGMAGNICQKLDSIIVDSLRNFLFGQPGSGGLDLASLNIQRARDHGIADYNSVRVGLGLNARTNFNQLTTNTSLANALSGVYGGDINKVDLWVAGLVEDPVSPSQLGETFHNIVRNQFIRTRNGDPLWYERRLTGKLLTLVRNTKLSDVIARNTNAKVQKECMKLA